MNAHSPTLATTLWPVEGRLAWLRSILLVVGGSLLLTLSAKIRVPIWEVPITMQTFAVLLIGMAYGWRLGAATVVAYLAQGLAGLPVFTNPGAGPAYLLGPTGGYLAGFVLAAAAVGWLAERGWDRHLLTIVPTLIIGNVLIYVPGLVWLHQILVTADPAKDWATTLSLGVTPFLVGDALKLALAAALLPAAWKIIGRRG
ncbi:MAG: biotin transporter BioY [Rhodospirillaceae bacterium]|nr:biotin transporter BioY [Rhodospirillaceae bacterium]